SAAPEKESLIAKTTATAKEGLFRKSHFDRLETYINTAVARGEAPLAKMRSVCQTGQVVLSDLAEKARGAFATIQKDNERVHQLGVALEDRKEQSLRQVGGVLWSLAQSYERAQKRTEELLLEKLSWGQTVSLIFHKQQWQSEFQQSIDSQLHDSLKRQIENSIELLEGDLKAVW